MDVITHLWLATGWLTFVIATATRLIIRVLQIMAAADDDADRVARERIEELNWRR